MNISHDSFKELIYYRDEKCLIIFKHIITVYKFKECYDFS